MVENGGGGETLKPSDSRCFRPRLRKVWRIMLSGNQASDEEDGNPCMKVADIYIEGLIGS